jgi:hypothetical protein
MTREEAEQKARERGPEYGPQRDRRLPGGWSVVNVRRDAEGNRRRKGRVAENINGRIYLPSLVDIPEGMRYCHGCAEPRPIEDFRTRQQRGRLYRFSRCRACQNEYSRLGKERRRASARAQSPAQP